MSLKQRLDYDDIIFRLQENGGISVYWRQVTTTSLPEALEAQRFEVRRIRRFLPIPSMERFLPVFSSADIFHSSYFRFNLNPFSKNVITVYDFMYELGYLKTKGSFFNKLQKKAAIWQANVIVCISDSTKRDLIKLYPNLCKGKRVEVVYLDSPLQNIVQDSCSSRIKSVVKSPYILFVGKRSSYKNFRALATAFRQSSLSKGIHKICCVGPSFSKLEQQELSNLGIYDKVLNLQKVTDSELAELYQKAFVLVYPSLYEGFGLPPLEAMRCGCPVIASNTSSMPEVVGQSGILVDPRNIDEISAALEKLLDPKIRESYICKGLQQAKEFSWDRAIQKHIEIYQSLV